MRETSASRQLNFRFDPVQDKTIAAGTESARQQGRDAVLESAARQKLDALGLHEGALKVQVIWNSRLRSTAGYAKWPNWKVELNPRLAEFEGQVERTLLHELAHLIAYARVGRRKIEPHGPEWRQACVDLGIPDESARHSLPLPRTKQARKWTYQCPVCGTKVDRVKKFQRYTACLACCKKHTGGRYDARFQFVLLKPDTNKLAQEPCASIQESLSAGRGYEPSSRR